MSRFSDEVGRLNPELYMGENANRDSDSISASVCYRLSYCHEKEWLEVLLLKVNGLPREAKEAIVR